MSRATPPTPPIWPRTARWRTSGGRQFTLRWQSEGVAGLAERVGGRDVPVADRTAAEKLTNTRLYVAARRACRQPRTTSSTSPT